ncbi:hypothetical protein [Streptomyces sp. NPDC059761]|uniref:hypothetical protein n=1 Tax=Streptomyces sp. NPDC059761 TaxID=3346937 RepID=UPI00364B3022
MTTGGLPTNGGIAANIWLQVGNQYFYCRGATPVGTPRLVPLTAPPYGKTVYVYDNAKNTFTPSHLPFRLRQGAIFLLGLAALAAVMVPLMLSGHDPIMAKAATPLAVAAFLLAAALAQYAPLTPHDAISAAEAQQATYDASVTSQQEAAEWSAARQAGQTHALQQWAAAAWAQQAQINAALHPGQDAYRPYGQSPPL